MDFKKVTIDDYDRVWKYCSLYGENSCQHSFINMFTLYEKYGSKICEENGFLYVLRERMCDENTRVYLFPMGKGDKKRAVEKIISVFRFPA